MPDDPWLSYYGHPVLPAGFDSWAINGDEVDGAGVNEPVWPTLCDTFIALEVLIITPEMLEVFEGCADLTVASVADQVDMPDRPMTFVVPGLPLERVLAGADATYVVGATNNLVVFPAEQRTLVLTEEAA